MPQAIAAAAAWVATAATAAAATIGVSTTMGSALAIYSSVQAVATVALSVGLQVGISALTSPKVGGAGGAGSQVDFQSNPDAGIPYAVGETGTAGVYVYNTVGEAKNRNLLFNTVLSLGPIDAFTGFKAVDEEVTFGSLQQAVGGTYANRMWQNRQLGLTPSPAFGPPNTTDAGVLAEWTSAHKLSGLAASWYVLGYDQKTYASGAPAPMWKIRGVKAYDPRLDDTYPGGEGPQRWDDEATWAWSDNPWVHALTWCIGRTQNGRRVMGLGCALAGIDVAAFVEAANVADANGWKISGVVYSTDSKWEVLKAFCQAGGGRPIALGAKVSCLVNAPRVSIATLTGADIEGDPTITATQTRRSRVNAVVPRYRSEDHGWDIVAADPLVVDAYVTEDGGQRTQEIEFPLVPDVTQAAQLAAYAITNSREFGPNVIPVTPAKGWALKPGDCITIDEPELGIVGQKMLVVERERNLSTGGRILTCVSETDAKHDYCLGRVGTPPPTPGLSGVDPLPQAPEAGSWTAAAGFVGGEPDSRVPAIIVTGETDDPGASGVIVDYRLEDGEWSSVERPASVTNIAISPVASNATYEVRVRYRSMLGLEDDGVYLDLGSVTTGALVADDTKNVGTRTVAQVNQALDDLSPVTEAAEELADFVKNTAPYVADLKNAVATANAEAKASAYATIQTAIGAAKAREAIIASSYVDGKKPKTYALEVRGVADNAITQVAALGVVFNDNMAQVSEYIALQTGINEATASTLETVEAAVADNKATYDDFVLAQGSTNTATVEALTALTAEVDSNQAGFTDYTKAQADINEANASTLTALKADVDDNKATYDAFVTTQVDLNASLANATTALATDFADFAGEVATTYATKSYADGAVSSYDTTLKTWNTSKDNPLFVIADTTVNTVTDIMGNVYGSAGFGINAGGAIASVRAFASGGFAETSLVRIQADRFQIQAGTESATTGLAPFTYDAGTGTLFVNNVTLRRGNIQGAAIATALGFDWTGGVTLTASNAAVGPGQAVTISDGVADIFIDVFLYAENTAPSSGQDVTVKLYKDGSLFKQRFFKIGIENQGHINFPVLDLGVTGSHTYSLEATATPGTGSYCTATAAVLRLMPLFRTGT